MDDQHKEVRDLAEQILAKALVPGLPIAGLGEAMALEIVFARTSVAADLTFDESLTRSLRLEHLREASQSLYGLNLEDALGDSDAGLLSAAMARCAECDIRNGDVRIARGFEDVDVLGFARRMARSAETAVSPGAIATDVMSGMYWQAVASEMVRITDVVSAEPQSVTTPRRGHIRL